MLAYEIYEYCSFILTELGKMDELYNIVTTFGDAYEDLKEKISTQIFAEATEDNSHKNHVGNPINKICYSVPKSNGELSELSSAFSTMTSGFDFIGFPTLWNTLKQDVTSKQIELEIEDLLFNEYEQSVDLFLARLREYFQDISKAKQIILSNQVLESNRLRQYLISHYKETLSMLEIPPLSMQDAEATSQYFSLQLLKVDLSMEQFSLVLLNIEQIYLEIAMIVEEDACSPQIAKIESGSLLVAILGNPIVIAALGLIFTKCVDLAFKKYTTEEKLASLGEYIAVTKEMLELKLALDEAGADTTDMAEALDIASTRVGKQLSQILATGSPYIKINEEKHSIDENLATKYLGEHKNLMLAESKEQSDD